MDCLSYQKQIPLLLDELLDAEEAQELRAHLSICSPCQGEKSRSEKLFGLASALAPVSPSPEVWQKIRQALREPRPLPWSERLSASLDRAREAMAHYLPSYAAGAFSAVAVFVLFFKSSAPAENSAQEIPLPPASLVSDTPPQEGYPMRLVKVKPDDPNKRYIERDGQLWEIDRPVQQARDNYPVREIGVPAVYRNRDF